MKKVIVCFFILNNHFFWQAGRQAGRQAGSRQYPKTVMEMVGINFAKRP